MVPELVLRWHREGIEGYCWGAQVLHAARVALEEGAPKRVLRGCGTNNFIWVFQHMNVGVPVRKLRWVNHVGELRVVGGALGTRVDVTPSLEVLGLARRRVCASAKLLFSYYIFGGHRYDIKYINVIRIQQLCFVSRTDRGTGSHLLSLFLFFFLPISPSSGSRMCFMSSYSSWKFHICRSSWHRWGRAVASQQQHI